MDVRAWLVMLVGAAAVLEDLRTRHISNWTSGGAVASGLAVHAYYNGLGGLGVAAGGMLIGFGVFLLFYLLGGMGGGDVKLMAGFGALLGSSLILDAAFLAALCGGLLAALTLAVRGVRRRLASSPANGGAGVLGAGPGKWSECIPYAPAITAGSWLALWIGR